jgi:hypothetical protein
MKVLGALRATRLACLSRAKTAWSKEAASGAIFQSSDMTHRRASAQTQAVTLQGPAEHLDTRHQMRTGSLDLLSPIAERSTEPTSLGLALVRPASADRRSRSLESAGRQSGPSTKPHKFPLWSVFAPTRIAAPKKSPRCNFGQKPVQMLGFKPLFTGSLLIVPRPLYLLYF